MSNVEIEINQGCTYRSKGEFMENVEISACGQEVEIPVATFSSIEQEYIDFICNIHCPYFLQERSLLVLQEGAIVAFDKDKQVAGTEIDLIRRMGYIPKTAKVINEPKRPKSPTDNLTVHNVNRVNEVMKLFVEGVARYNALNQVKQND